MPAPHPLRDSSHFHFANVWIMTMAVLFLYLPRVAEALSSSCQDTRRRLLVKEDLSGTNKFELALDSSWLEYKRRCGNVDFKLILHVGLDSHVQMLATPVDRHDDDDDDDDNDAPCHSVILQDTIQLNSDTRGKEAIIIGHDERELVDKLEREGLDLPRIGTKTYKWNHIATAFERARRGQPGGYDILRNCCASFVVDMMSYSGSPADVNALVKYFIERWVYAGRSELLNRDYLADLIPQAGVLRGLLGRAVSDESLVSMIVKYYVWEYYDPKKADMQPGSAGYKWGSGNDPMEYFVGQLSAGVDEKYKLAKEQVEKQGLDESYLYNDYSSSSTMNAANNNQTSAIIPVPLWLSVLLDEIAQWIESILEFLRDTWRSVFYRSPPPKKETQHLQQQNHWRNLRQVEFQAFVAADAYVYLIIDNGIGEAFFFTSCFQEGSNFPIFLNLNDASSTLASTVRNLERMPLNLPNGATLLLNDWEDAIQRNSAEWSGRYDLANQNCAIRNLNVVTSLDPDFVLTAEIKTFLAQKLTDNGVATALRQDTPALSSIFGNIGSLVTGDLPVANDVELVLALIDHSIALFGTCGNGIVNPSEDCDQGIGVNGSPGSSCSVFCSWNSGWFCPANYVVSEESAILCVLEDSSVCTGNCPRDNCLSSPYNPSFIENPSPGCRFRFCPWAKGFIRIDDTTCVAEEEAGGSNCDGECQRRKCLAGGGEYRCAGFQQCLVDIEALNEIAGTMLYDPIPFCLDTFCIQEGSPDVLPTLDALPHLCINIPCSRTEYFGYSPGNQFGPAGAFTEEADSCLTAIRPFCGQFCAEKICIDEGGCFKGELDFSRFPFTCEFRPSTDRLCREETGRNACETQDGCQWCAEFSVCKNGELDCPVDPPGEQTPSTCEPQDQTLQGFDGGWPGSFQGWYDTQGCGVCNDFCRFAGNTNPAPNDPDPRIKNLVWAIVLVLRPCWNWSRHMDSRRSVHTILFLWPHIQLPAM